MADRGRDLKFSILSDISKFDTDAPAKGLEDLADAAKLAGKTVDRLADDLRESKGFRDLERGAKDTARTVDTAFDRIAKSSRTAARKVDDEMDDAGKALDEFKDEARSSGREAAASFGGGFDDIGDFIQETAANAFGGFGPIGAAAGIAAAAGIGIITKAFGDSKEKAEEAKAAIGDWVQAFIDGQGKISAATIEGKLQDMLGDPDKYREIIDLTDRAHISAALYARALAGDAEAAAKVREQIIAHQQALAANTDATSANAAGQADQAVQLQKVAENLSLSTSQINKGRDAWQLLDEATAPGITAEVTVNAPTQSQLQEEHRAMVGALGRPITVPVATSGGYAAAIAERNRIQSIFNRNPVTIPVNPKPGKGQGYGVVRNVP